MVTVIVKTHGMIFDGKWAAILEAGIKQAQNDVGDYAISAIKNNLDDVLIENNGGYVGSIHSEWETDDLAVTDGTVYGPWLEGLGTRNATSRFKGYWTFRLTTDVIKEKVDVVAEPAIAAAVASINVY